MAYIPPPTTTKRQNPFANGPTSRFRQCQQRQLLQGACELKYTQTTTGHRFGVTYMKPGSQTWYVPYGIPQYMTQCQLSKAYTRSHELTPTDVTNAVKETRWNTACRTVAQEKTYGTGSRLTWQWGSKNAHNTYMQTGSSALTSARHPCRNTEQSSGYWHILFTIAHNVTPRPPYKIMRTSCPERAVRRKIRTHTENNLGTICRLYSGGNQE